MISVKSSFDFRLDPDYLAAICNSDAVQEFTYQQAKRLRFAAWRIAFAAIKHTHPVTNPPYLDSFGIKQIQKGKYKNWIVYNFDPATIMVEFGSHAGGKTEVLGYRPLGRGLDAVASGHE